LDAPGWHGGCRERFHFRPTGNKPAIPVHPNCVLAGNVEVRDIFADFDETQID
jgi:hypothetical protein